MNHSIIRTHLFLIPYSIKLDLFIDIGKYPQLLFFQLFMSFYYWNTSIVKLLCYLYPITTEVLFPTEQ